ncbi:outer membrane beta-barrel protein [Cytophaga aurantiaca]|uniref:outer membrane beta-barrel protein n=1 Tax=Cytophaga aurantiaca TaxID=29530 RepID=UPI000380006A|nr:outer membrane beta-barrel protein [Cytophaga aurantiaca]
MKKNILLLIAFLCIQVAAFSQNKIYGVFETKALFQVGMIEDSAGGHVKSILRFTPVANYTLMAHKDFNNKVGIYTGIGIKNVGFITRQNSSDMTVKSRAYCLSVPVGLKFGNFKEDNYLFIAGEFLTQLDYKEKVFIDGDKSKRKSFYDNDINLFNYSASIGFHLKGLIIGAEYTLSNFFDDKYRFQPVKSNSTTYAGPSKSNILTFFIGLRANLSAEEVSAPEKQVQQAKLYQY